VLVPSFVSNVEFWWAHPVIKAWLDRLASFARLILFDEMRADLAGKGLPERYWPTDAQLERAAALLRKALDSCATGNYGRRPEKSHSNAGPNCSRAERASVA
jgi:hypothetical protein